jgi:hypothetical protein
MRQAGPGVMSGPSNPTNEGTSSVAIHACRAAGNFPRSLAGTREGMDVGIDFSKFTIDKLGKPKKTD